MRWNNGTVDDEIRAYIGPHIGGCCYEVIEEFTSEDIYSNIKISNNNKLDLEKCILKQLVDKGGGFPLFI